MHVPVTALWAVVYKYMCCVAKLGASCVVCCLITDMLTFCFYECVASRYLPLRPS